MDRAEQVRQVLSTRGLTLYRVSQQSAETFGRDSKFFIPYNLYSDIAGSSLIPTIHQIFALSHITNYCLSDWLAVFGVNLELISSLQLRTPRRQTVLLDSSVYDMHAWIPWFAERVALDPVPGIAPLTQLLARMAPKRAVQLVGASKGRFLYARVGGDDVQAFPQLAPGSIVRVDTRLSLSELRDRNSVERRLFFVELASGWTCSQIRLLTKDRITLTSERWPCIHTELMLGREARILGVIDAEIRPVLRQQDAKAWDFLTVLSKPRPLLPLNPQTSLEDLLRSSRLRVRLSFREASSLSRLIATMLSDKLYFAAGSTLSDYETLAAPPRHVQKIIVLCVLYCIQFMQFLRSSGLPIGQEGREPIPDALVSREAFGERRFMSPKHGEEGIEENRGLLGLVLKQWQEIPLFLRHSLSEFCGIRKFSLSDLFWVGGDKAPIHPFLINADLVAVNRRVKKPVAPQSNVPCKRPLYLILKRDGTYVCGSCILRQGNLIVDSYSGGPARQGQFKNGIDAEVVGQVTAIVRWLAGSAPAEIPEFARADQEADTRGAKSLARAG